jgi:glutamate N-acetyltransferase/amino-acid N-acetyltransferase
METNSQTAAEVAGTEDHLPLGFEFASVAAGIKISGKSDFACARTKNAATATAVFTTNRIVAAPLTVGQRHLESSGNSAIAVVVNAGNANCATGEMGLQAAEQVCQAAGKAFGCKAEEVLPSSTGIIGVPLPVGKLIAAMPALKNSLGNTPAHFEGFARAIMTTDTRPKVAFSSVGTGRGKVRLAGVAKGAGMIHPRLGTSVPAVPHATMLAYVFTDAKLAPDTAADLLRDCAECSFNRISIDGDTSTNDTVMLLANGRSGIEFGSPDQKQIESASAFHSALQDVCISLAKQIVADGEGVQHVVELHVDGAPDDHDALRVARAIANSPLVKTAWAGCDPNWGRILAAVGYSGVFIDPDRISIRFGGNELCRDGSVSPLFDQEAVHRYLKQPEFTVSIDLGMGRGNCRFWTTDLTAEYVHINADYSS